MALFSSSGLNKVPGESTQTTVTPYAQPYVQSLLDKTQQLTSAPTPTYGGQLTAGYGDLQQQAWKGLSGLTLPNSLQTAGGNLQNISQQEQNLNYSPTAITAGQFSPQAAQEYMNPYIQQSLDPQLAALQRQQQINQQGDMAKLAQAGAFGGSRQAILQGQNNENLLRQQGQLIGQGYSSAYDKAAQQYNADQARNMQAQQLNQSGNQFAATYGLQGLQAAAQAQTAAATAGQQAAQSGLQGLQALNVAGTQQQQLDQQALNAQYNEYLRQLKYPQDMLTLQRQTLNGLPLTTTNKFTAEQSIAQKLAGGVSGAAGVIKDLTSMGMTPEKIKDYIKNMFTGTNKLTDEQVQAELDRVYQESQANRAPPDDAVAQGDGTYTRSNDGIIETYDRDGNLIGAERDRTYDVQNSDNSDNSNEPPPEDNSGEGP